MHITEVLNQSLPDICETSDIVQTGIVDKESILRERVRQNLLPKYIKIGRLVRYRKKDILDWVSQECPCEGNKCLKMTVAEVAKYLKISDNTVYVMLKEGLHSEKINGITHISKDDLEEWLNKRVHGVDKPQPSRALPIKEKALEAAELPVLCTEIFLVKTGVMTFNELREFKEKYPSLKGLQGNSLYPKESILEYIKQKRSK